MAGRPARNPDLRFEIGQFGRLTGHFFGRLFRNDVIDFEDQMKERLFAVLAVLAVLVGWCSELLLFKYNFLPDAGLSWQEKGFLMTLLMVLFGIVSLLEWDILFPDRQDFLNLAPLPLRLRTVFAAKLGSFVLFIGLFSAAMNSLSSAVFTIYLAPWRSGSVLFLLRHAGAHLGSAFAACFFVFFACVFIQSLLMALFPARLFRRLSPPVRSVLITACVFLLLALFAQPGLVSRSFHSLGALKDGGDPLLYRFPPFWFSGLYETLLGTHDPVFWAQARTAGWSLVFSLGAFVLAGGLSYRRHVVRTLESRKSLRKRGGFRRGMAAGLQGLIMPAPEERAVSLFFSRTLRASPRHRMTLGYYLAAGAGLVAVFVAGTGGHAEKLSPANAGLLVQPLLLSFLMLAGLKAAANIPVEPDANWIFRTTETPRRSKYLSGLKKTIFARWLLPLFAFVLAIHLVFWDPRTAVAHAVFGLTVSGLALGALFSGYRKVPFACACVPGKARLQTRVILYVVLAVVFFSACGAVERRLLERPAGFLYFYALAAALWGLLRLKEGRLLRGGPLLYEEEPEPALVVFPGAP
jgi:hypothetical protein